MAKHKLPNNMVANKAGLDLSMWYRDKEYLSPDSDDLSNEPDTPIIAKKYKNVKSFRGAIRGAKKSAEKASKNLIKKSTPTENMFYKKLYQLGYSTDIRDTNAKGFFVFQYPVVHEDRWAVIDFYFPGMKLAIELDGISHFSRKAIAIDSQRGAWIRKYKNITIVRLTNHQAYKLTLEEIQLIIDSKKVNIDVNAVKKRPTALSKQPYMIASRMDSAKLGFPLLAHGELCTRRI